MSSASEPTEEIECSYEDDSFETAEESILADHRSSPIVWGRQESVFLAESSSSAEEDGPFLGRAVSESDSATPSVNATETASTITEEPDYTDQFEALGSNFSEEELSIKVSLNSLNNLISSRVSLSLLN